MGAVQYGTPEFGGLNRVLTAMLYERAANENRGREPIEQAQLADGVSDVDFGRALR
jgi:hypothetical protein